MVQFIHHDYYFIAIVPSIIFVTTLSLVNLGARFERKVIKFVGIFLVLVLSILSLNYARLNLHRRYSDNIDSSSIVRYQISDIRSFLQELRVDEHSKFLVIGDKTQNGSLVFLNRFGWTYPDFNLDFGSVQSNMPLADYLLILRPSAHKIPDDLKLKLVKCEKYNYNSNFIYDLKNYGR
ncbi:MAG: hypothetical protein V4635_12085 [Bacteroidota bacterium]